MARKALIYYQDDLAGYLSETDSGYEFVYDQSYLKGDHPKPISLTIPLSEDVYYSNVLFSFFDGLIPEGWLLDIGERYWKLNPGDRFELLINLCRDAIGAVSVVQEKEEGNV